MKKFNNKLVHSHQFLFEEEMSSIIDNLDASHINYIDTIIQKVNRFSNSTDNLENNLLDLPLRKKFELIVLIYNKSNDIVLYPKDMRDKYIEQWSKNIGIETGVLRRCLGFGPDKIDEILSEFDS